MQLQPLALLAALATMAAGTCSAAAPADPKSDCQVTKPPVPAFVPPPPYRTPSSGNQFLYGTPALWVLVTPRWRVHGGSKLPYFREGYDWRQEPDPRLTVVARRLDSPQPMVWAGWANSGSIDGTPGGMFMVTGLDVPTAGCWEIAAYYHPDRRTAQTLTYTVWVEPE